MISKSIKIGDKDIDFTCSAGTLVRYRDDFNSDLMTDMQKLTGNSPDLDVLSKLAYTMAKQAGGKEFPEYIDWLDQFDMVEFMTALAEITAMWGQNNKTSSISKKK